LFFAFSEERVLAGLITLHYNRNAIYAYGASLKESAALSKQPNEAVFWHAIQAMKAADMEVFDFGSTPLSNKGLLQFKKKWATRTEDLFYLYGSKKNRVKGINRKRFSRGLVSGALKLLPERVFEFLGERLIRQVG
jgi:lipid II:glycine glycyltransferase (peptidoglycan interpeptide bridge formation enzyme)